MNTRRHIAPIRFGYGLRLGEDAPADPEAWLERQIASKATPPEGASVADALQARITQQRDARERSNRPPAADGMQAPPVRGPLQEIMFTETRAWATWRVGGQDGFRDRLVDFWANHFTISRRSVFVGGLNGPLEREAIRPHLTGRFADMLVAVTRHPGMLLYLDNHVSVGPASEAGRRSRRGLNENLAREVLELHTLSPAGGYTQGDVQELARILTGWSVALDRDPWGFVWRPAAHEPGAKTLLGRSFAEGPDSQEAALRFLGTHPATYRHLAVKLARHFVADEPPAAAIRRLDEVLRQTEGDLGAVARALVAMPEAWSNPLGKFRAPLDFAIAAARAVGAPRGELALAGMATLGQPLWLAPQPNGWGDRAEDWAAPEALMRRVDWIYTTAGRLERSDVAAVTAAALGPLARAETVGAMRGAGSVRDALTLLLASPEFMHR
jgi:uncharacterized protein (DUF1800 family)